MAGPAVRALRASDVEWLAALHNDAFSDYAVAARLDAAALAFYMEETSVAPELSRVAFVDGAPASFCLAALRGTAGSIRGEGTAVASRRRGLGARVLEATLEALAAAGATRVGLEVLTANAPALALYRGHGFVARRRLAGWALPRRPRAPARRDRVREVEPGPALARLEAWGWQDAPWQLQPASLAHQPAFALGDAAVAFGKPRSGHLWLYALAVDPAERRRGLATRLLRGLPGSRVGVPPLLPDDWPAAVGFLEASGGERERHAQWEMARPLPEEA